MEFVATSIPPELLTLNKQLEDATFGSLMLFLLWTFVLSRAMARLVLHLHYEFMSSKSPPAFHDKHFWDAEYKSKKAPFEWYIDTSDLLPIISPHIPSQARILYPGCGTSQLPQSLRRSIPDCRVICCDNSEIAIKRAQEVSGGSPGVEYRVMDVGLTRWYFRKDSFDVVVDKGLVDSLLHDEEYGASKVGDCFNQYFAVLKDEGICLFITTLDESVIEPLIWDSPFVHDGRVELDGNKPEWVGKRRNALYVLHVDRRTEPSSQLYDNSGTSSSAFA